MWSIFILNAEYNLYFYPTGWGYLLTSWDPVRTAFRMLMDWGTGAASGCGEEGADRLVICEQVDVWSSDKLYIDRLCKCYICLCHR